MTDTNEDTMFQYAMLSQGAYGGKDVEGYTIDPELSNENRTTYIKDGKAVVAFRGTDLSGKNKWKDLGSDALILLGLKHLGSRFKNAKRTTEQAITKYGKENVSTTGHSLGGSQSLYVNSQTGLESHAFNPGVSPLDIKRSSGKFNASHMMSLFRKKPKSNSHSYITGYDPISMLSPLLPNLKTHIIRKSQKNAHSLKNFLKKSGGLINFLKKSSIKNKRQMTSSWIQHVKDYASKHNVSYKQAMKEAKGSYKSGGCKGGGVIKGSGTISGSVSFDIPLFIRLLEYAKETATSDIQLHDIAEIAQGIGRPLRMRDYKKLVAGKSGGIIRATTDASY